MKYEQLELGWGHKSYYYYNYKTGMISSYKLSIIVLCLCLYLYLEC